MALFGPVRHVFPAVYMHPCLVLVHPFMPTSTPISSKRTTTRCTSQCRITSSSSIHCSMFFPTFSRIQTSSPSLHRLSRSTSQPVSFIFTSTSSNKTSSKTLSHSSQHARTHARIPALIIYVSIPLVVFISHKKGSSWGEQALRITPERRKNDRVRSEQYFTVPYNTSTIKIIKIATFFFFLAIFTLSVRVVEASSVPLTSVINVSFSATF
jgi:hypothetical protein